MAKNLAYVRQEEMGIFDGSKRDGIMYNGRFISYFQFESALLEFPGVVEAGVIADTINDQDYILKVYLALEEPLSSEKEAVSLCEEVSEYISSYFDIDITVKIKVKEKIPMTRSGKILRTILREWD